MTVAETLMQLNLHSAVLATDRGRNRSELALREDVSIDKDQRWECVSGCERRKSVERCTEVNSDAECVQFTKVALFWGNRSGCWKHGLWSDSLSLSVIPKLWHSYFCIFSLNYHMIRRGLKNVGKMLQFSPSTEQRAILIFLRFQDKALL